VSEAGGGRESCSGVLIRGSRRNSPSKPAEAEGWPTQEMPPPPARVVPPMTVVNHPYYRMMFNGETYALDNKSVVYTRHQARTLGRRKMDVAQFFGIHDEWDGPPPAQIFQFLR